MVSDQKNLAIKKKILTTLSSHRGAVDPAVQQAHHGQVGKVVDDVEAAVVLVQAEELLRCRPMASQRMTRLTPAWATSRKAASRCGQQLLKPGQDPAFHVREAFASGDAEVGEVPEAASNWLGYCS